MRLPFHSSYPITQPFGVNPADYAKFGMAGHNGIDYGLPSGTPVLAATNGLAYVLYEAGGFGNYIQIVGPQYKTIYAHLQKALVANGALVSEGQVIGLSDNTGNSSGPHLHFGVKPIPQDNNNGYFGAIDPQPLITGDTNLDYKALYELLKTERDTVTYPRIELLQNERDKVLYPLIEQQKAKIAELEKQLDLAKQSAGQVTPLAPGLYSVS
jgi:Peptidase family M23